MKRNSGGSLRIPAHFSGCFSLKPCHGRFPSTGCRGFNPGFTAIPSSMGPMGRSVVDVELLSRVMLDASVDLAQSETGLIPLAYCSVELPKKLRIGYFTHDGFCRASPACQRAVMETVEALRREGHECVEFEPPSRTLVSLSLRQALSHARATDDAPHRWTRC